MVTPRTLLIESKRLPYYHNNSIYFCTKDKRKRFLSSSRSGHSLRYFFIFQTKKKHRIPPGRRVNKYIKYSNAHDRPLNISR